MEFGTVAVELGTVVVELGIDPVELDTNLGHIEVVLVPDVELSYLAHLSYNP